MDLIPLNLHLQDEERSIFSSFQEIFLMYLTQPSNLQLMKYKQLVRDLNRHL